MPPDRDYKSTLNLPTTAFPMKANLPQREPEMLARWQAQRTYEALLERTRGGEPFVFHDGPPYANNHIHQGHMLNKVLKDIVVKFRAMEGRHVRFVPGWDCHGLPIELEVDKKLGPKKRDMTRVQIRDACREYAAKWIDVQREEFRRLGVFATWDDPYLTMDHRYEADIVRELARFVKAGSVYRGKKPVYWCIHDRTALAEAEVEYADHTSPSIHVAFDVVEGAPERLAGEKLRVVIWTTTPWTLPANLAVAVHPDFTYVAYRLGDSAVIVARELLARFLAEVAPAELKTSGVELQSGSFEATHLADPSRVLAFFEGKELTSLKYRHPFLDRVSPVILGEHVTLDQGTGLVHTAPGHGEEDYVVGLKVGLAILNPVDGAGRFTEEAGADLAGKQIFQANPEIVEKLRASGHLLAAGEVKHSYPHCWRCSNPVVFRATDQWFISMETNALRERSLAAIDGVTWVPRWGRERIHGMVESRPDWCISRQRVWGVPIPVLYCTGCDEALCDPDVMERAAQIFEEESASAWFARPPGDFLPEGKSCPRCGGREVRAESDILDVWFDSGSSFAAVLERRGLGFPADLYLEGSDQHRGWFHSALLISVGTRGEAPYRTVLTHGFVVDAEGRKISKRLGNYVDPLKLLAQHGADLMRLWVASEDYTGDIRTSDAIFGQLGESYFRIRNTLRYCLSNLFDFDPAVHAVPPEELPPLDAWAQARLSAFVHRAHEAYDAYEFHAVVRAAMEFCSGELSSVYLDARKDLLYTFARGSRERRATQTVLFAIARDMCRVLAPVLSFTAEEAYGHLPGAREASVFFTGLPDSTPRPGDAELQERFTRLLAVRDAASRALEAARKGGLIGKSLEAQVTLVASGEELAFLRAAAADLETLLILSAPPVVREGSGALAVEVARAPGTKCARCWRVREDLGVDPDHPAICARCTDAVKTP